MWDELNAKKSIYYFYYDAKLINVYMAVLHNVWVLNNDEGTYVF